MPQCKNPTTPGTPHPGERCTKFWDAGIELFCIFCPWVLGKLPLLLLVVNALTRNCAPDAAGYIGAKHRDSQVLWSYLITGGFCFLAFVPEVSYLIFINLSGSMNDSELAKAQKVCAVDPGEPDASG